MLRAIAFAALTLFGAARGADAQLLVGDFECQAPGAVIPVGTPDCEGWTATGFAPILPAGGAITCSTMPTSGSSFCEIPVGTQIASPTPTIGSPAPVYPFAPGTVREISMVTVAQTGSISVDWFYLGNPSGNGTCFVQIAVIDPATNQIIAPLVVQDEATMGLVPATGCTTSFGSSVNGSLPSVQTATAAIPPAYVGSPVKISAVMGQTIPILSIFPVAYLYVDNVRFDLPPDPARLVLDPSASSLTFDAAQGTFSVAGTVAGFFAIDGSFIGSPTVDPIVGASVTLNGLFTGSPTNLATAVFGPALLVVTVAPGMDELVAPAILQPQPSLARYVLGGSLGATPIRRLAHGDGATAQATRIGSGSAALDSMHARMGTEELTFQVEIAHGATARPFAIGLGDVPAAQESEMRLATDGAGAFALGIIGLGGARELYTLIDVNPTVPEGAGPFFGLALTPLLLDVLRAPNPFGPFRQTSFADGSWSYVLPTGTLPTGFLLDAVTLAVPGPTGTGLWASAPVRVTF